MRPFVKTDSSDSVLSEGRPGIQDLYSTGINFKGQVKVGNESSEFISCIGHWILSTDVDILFHCVGTSLLFAFNTVLSGK